ncbi:MAG: PEP-CTERM sorting domain-containing protein [Desulfobulbaceae bacterium]|nr:PEP-CTERM sorting domain-containing protein [Desulfobulbaceae bacterium]
MKKQILKSALIAVAGIGLLAGSAMADELTLQEIFNNITVGPSGSDPGNTFDSSVNTLTEMISDGNDSYWNITASGGSFVTMIIEIAGFSGQNTFGVYDIADKTNIVQLFDGSSTTGSQQTLTIHDNGDVYVLGGTVYKGTFSSETFGYYIGTPNGEYFSDSTLNSNTDYMLAYQGKDIDNVKIGSLGAGTWTANEYILAFEDGTDFDHNDMVLMVESVNPVPEPATMLLFGAGIAGLAGIARRKKTN